ncbi:MAG: Rpn family recombination-promoting nuclease/putative transposase [Lachnospiraceae bacterium]|nr:Rpn family recombination-promoting nuclease/putative transposase [Lachnospiraceae bacterium]
MTDAENRMMQNRKAADSGGKLIFGNPTLLAQLLRDYSGMEILKDVRPEDIEDVTTRYIPMFTEERDSDVVKKVRLPKQGELFLITLVEHKSYVEYNVVMQLLRYMVYIWEDYEKQKEKEQKGITRTKGFRYPPILPIVYYEGVESWNSCQTFAERIFCSDVFSKYIPDFRYMLVNIRGMDREAILSKDDELSLVMLLNRLKSSKEFRELKLPEGYLDEIARKAPEDVLEVITRVVSVLLRGLNVPEKELQEFTDQIRRRRMGKLFEGFEWYDVQATRKEIQDLKDENAGLKDENAGLKDENTGLKDENTGLKDENTGLKDENTGLRDEISTLKRLLAENGISVPVGAK